MKLKLMILAGLSMTTAAFSQAHAMDTYKIDPAHVWVTFSINHAGWSSAQGIFRKVEGTILFDKENPSKSSVKATIDAASIDTNLAQRNKDLNSPDFLNTAEFPTITFESVTLEKTGEKTGKLTGKLSIIGSTLPVTLDVTWSGQESPFPWAPKVLRTGFTATGSFKPADFGMAKVPAFGLGPDIQVSINVEAERQ